MSGLSKRDAAQLVADIREAHVAGHVIAERTGAGSSGATAGFLGGLESVLCHFLRNQGCSEAAAELARAMNDAPSTGEIAARIEKVAAWSTPRTAA